MKVLQSSDISVTANDVAKHFADLGAKLKVEILEDSEALIEGDKTSLEFLANYILAYVSGDEHARNINPNGAGSDFFKKGSTHGLYLHLVPCRHGHDD